MQLKFCYDLILKVRDENGGYAFPYCIWSWDLKEKKMKGCAHDDWNAKGAMKCNRSYNSLFFDKFRTLNSFINNNIVWNLLCENRYKSYFMNIRIKPQVTSNSWTLNLRKIELRILFVNYIVVFSVMNFTRRRWSYIWINWNSYEEDI